MTQMTQIRSEPPAAFGRWAQRVFYVSEPQNLRNLRNLMTSS